MKKPLFRELARTGRFRHVRVSSELSRTISHGEAAGLKKKTVMKALRTVFTQRRLLSHSVRPWIDARSFVKGRQTPLQLTVDYVPKYALD